MRTSKVPTSPHSPSQPEPCGALDFRPRIGLGELAIMIDDFRNVGHPADLAQNVNYEQGIATVIINPGCLQRTECLKHQNVDRQVKLAVMSDFSFIAEVASADGTSIGQIICTPTPTMSSFKVRASGFSVIEIFHQVPNKSQKIICSFSNGLTLLQNHCANSIHRCERRALLRRMNIRKGGK